jgi:hypothetical protein
VLGGGVNVKFKLIVLTVSPEGQLPLAGDHCSPTCTSSPSDGSRYTLHVTRHTSHVTRHTSLLKACMAWLLTQGYNGVCLARQHERGLSVKCYNFTRAGGGRDA